MGFFGNEAVDFVKNEQKYPGVLFLSLAEGPRCSGVTETRDAITS